jgi:hypothetical protein
MIVLTSVDCVPFELESKVRKKFHKKCPKLAQKCNQITTATSAFYRCILTRMHGRACIFWADLTPFSLKMLEVRTVQSAEHISDRQRAVGMLEREVCLVRLRFFILSCLVCMDNRLENNYTATHENNSTARGYARLAARSPRRRTGRWAGAGGLRRRRRTARSLALPDPAMQVAYTLLGCSGAHMEYVLGPRFFSLFFKQQDYEKRTRAEF